MTPRPPFSDNADEAQPGGGREGSGAGHDSPSPWAPPAADGFGSPAAQPHPAGPYHPAESSTPPGAPYPPPSGPPTGGWGSPAGPASPGAGGSRPPAPLPGGTPGGSAGPGGGLYGPPAGGSGGGAPWTSQWGAAPVGGGYPPTGQLPTGDPSGPQGRGGTVALRRRRLVAAGLALALVSAGVGGAVGALVAGDDGGSTVVTTAGLERNSSTEGGTSPAASDTVSAAAKKILPSVVTISEESSSESGTGSGTIIRADGHILTNNHVVSGAADGGTLTVTLQDGRTFSAQVVGTDPSSDLAIIKINASGLTAATFGNSDSLNIGELVVAVGSPLGLNGTVTSGIVSAVHRPVRTGDSTVRDQQNTVLDAIQTDAPINPGNSGGPLVNSRGEIIGVNSAIATVGGGSSPFGGTQQSGNIGVGFAIPGNYAESVATQLITAGRAQHPYLGVAASTADENTRSTAASGTGAQIRTMVSGGPAESAGLRVGDVITKLGDRAIPDVDSLIAAVRSHGIGDDVEVTYTRDGKSTTTTAKLALQPPTS
nr:trypsin-like peptidase domain-containing protein [Candidatus Frankia nodulisporulans]